MKTIIEGKAYLFGDNIDTDQIYPGRYLELVKPEDIASHCLEGVDPSFVKKAKQGDIVVAGRNFGCGSSREHAAITLVHAGVSVVLAESFARIFYRNAINLALPLMVCPGISGFIEDGDTIEVDLLEGTITNKANGQSIKGQQISEYAMNILQSGGIKPMFRNKIKG